MDRNRIDDLILPAAAFLGFVAVVVLMWYFAGIITTRYFSDGGLVVNHTQIANLPLRKAGL
jgi:hypothetical protein